MSNLMAARRVTIFSDALFEDVLTQELRQLGAKGYTCTDCRGRGEHEIVQDLYVNSSRVRIETIVPPHVAEAIMNFVESPQFANQALTACIDEVLVSSLDRI
jgi:hypothetical protein